MKTWNRKSKKWLYGGAFAMVTAGIGFSVWPGARQNDVGAKEQGAASGKSSPPQTPSRPPGPATAFTTAAFFPRGVEQDYEMHQNMRLTTSSGQVITEIEFDGPLRIAGLESSAGPLVRGEFEGSVKIAAGGNQSAPAGASLTELAHHPFFLEFAEDGSFRGARGDRAVPPMIARIWAAIGEYLQLTRQESTEHWTSRETDATGDYLAEYEQSGPNEVKKRKLRYESMRAKGFTSYAINWSQIDFQVDAEHRLQAYTMAERSRADPGEGPMPAFESASVLALKRTHVGSQQDRMSAWLAEASSAMPLQQVQRDQDQHARDQARAASTTVAAVFDRLRGFQKENPSKEERDRAGLAFAALTSMLREDPSLLGIVRKHLEAKGPDVETMLAALRDASTPDSQKLLAEMTLPSSPLGPEDRMEAARSLSRVPTPSAETVHTLTELRNDPDVGIQANYGLGSALHRVKDSDPVLASEVRNTLVDQIDGTTSNLVKTETLIAFGNGGDPETLPTIRKYVGDPSPDVRAAAAQGLRRIPGDEADRLLAGLCGDPVTDVRYQAVDAIRERPASQTLAIAVSALAIGEPDFRVRAASVRVLTDWVTVLPAVAETLKTVLARDGNPDLRNLAKNALATL